MSRRGGRRRESAGTRSPAINSTMSRGASWSIGTNKPAPSRMHQDIEKIVQALHYLVF